MLTTFYPPYHFGGDATYVQALSEALVRRGHQVTVVHCEDAFRLNASTEAVESQDSSAVKVHRIKRKAGPLSPLITQQLGVPGLKSSELKSLLKQDFDVVNFHNISLIGGPGVISLSNARVNLYTLHEHWLVCPTHIFWKNGRAPCDSRQCIRCCIRSGIPPQLWRYGPLISRNIAKIDSFISPSAYTAQKHKELLNDGLNIEVLPLFSRLSPDQLDYSGSDSGPEFLYVGRVTASKGIAQLLASFSKWPRFKLTIVGGGDLLEDLQNEYRDAANIVFTGPLPPKKVEQFYRSALALILPSLAPETFGLTVVEAFAFGTPAIVRSAGGNRETVDQSAAGFLYKTESELLGHLETLAKDRQLRIKLGHRARSAYEKHYTEEIHTQRYLRLIDKIQSRKSAGPYADRAQHI